MHYYQPFGAALKTPSTNLLVARPKEVEMVLTDAVLLLITFFCFYSPARLKSNKF